MKKRRRCDILEPSRLSLHPCLRSQAATSFQTQDYNLAPDPCLEYQDMFMIATPFDSGTLRQILALIFRPDYGLGFQEQPGVAGHVDDSHTWLVCPSFLLLLNLASTYRRYRCRANMAHTRHSGPDSGLGFQEHVLKTMQVIPSTLESGSEAGSYLRLIDFVHHSTLGLRVIKKKRRSMGVPRASSCQNMAF